MRTSGKVISRFAFALAVLAMFLPSAPASAAFYLHGTGPNANPPILFLDNTAPTATTEKYRDSSGVNFSGGNPWKKNEPPAGPSAAPAKPPLARLDIMHRHYVSFPQATGSARPWAAPPRWPPVRPVRPLKGAPRGKVKINTVVA